MWAVDEEHLPHYLLPRDCPRVCWATAGCREPVLTSPAARVVAIEHGWVRHLPSARLFVHLLNPAGFNELDKGAGYWVADRVVRVLDVRQVDDCFAVLGESDIELRLTESLWPYVDAVVAGAEQFSAIRMRHALPREP